MRRPTGRSMEMGIEMGASMKTAAKDPLDNTFDDPMRPTPLVLGAHDLGTLTDKVCGIVEKPPAGTEPSHLVSLGRYLYTPDLFPLLAEGWARFEGKEFYPMDALCTLAERGRVAVEVVSSPHYDTGAPLGYLKTVIEHGLAHEAFGPELEAWLRQRLR